MSKLLADLLGINDPLFGIKMSNLEKACGHPGADVRLSAELIASKNQKLRELGLSTSDTTAKELYHALLNLIKKHDAFLGKQIGVYHNDSSSQILKKIQKYVTRLDIPKTTWAIKSTSAKKLIKQNPPKKVMKQLGYRSIDSMLKRESVIELLAGARFIESQTWHDQMIKKYKTLEPRDFEPRTVEIIQFDEKKWGAPAKEFVRTKRFNITHLKEFGVVILLPLPINNLNGLCITILPLLLHYIEEVRSYGAFFKIQQINPQFGNILVKVLDDDHTIEVNVAGHGVHWRIVRRHFGKINGSKNDYFEPHLQAEDLSWKKAEETLFRIEPALHFWNDMDFVLANMDSEIISFNIIDLAVCFVNNIKYEDRVLDHGRQSLWNEIMSRYIGYQSLENQIMNQLNMGNIDQQKYEADMSFI